jgi:hypothetical protein
MKALAPVLEPLLRQPVCDESAARATAALGAASMTR